jgi:hypothetical protein
VKERFTLLFLSILLLLLFACKKEIIVTSIDQVPGTWQWESHCGGGDLDTCIYRSDTEYATIEFKTDGKYLEKHNDTIFLQSTYHLINLDGTFGTLIIDSPYRSYPITIMDNMLLITKADYMDSYRKIK